ncbi:hypothetical protein ACOMHN_003592 [Nucella lapillus]
MEGSTRGSLVGKRKVTGRWATSARGHLRGVLCGFDIAHDSSGLACGNSYVSAFTVIKTTYIASQTTNIASQTTNIASQTTYIASQTTKIASQTTNIASQTTNIASQTTNIASQTTNIASQTTNIASQTTNIASQDCQKCQGEVQNYSFKLMCYFGTTAASANVTRN